MNLRLTLEAARLVRAPRPLVWRVFSDLTAWPAWNPHCRQAPAGGLEPGARLDLWLRPLGLPLMVRAQVTEAVAAQAVGWRGRAWGISSQQRYTFSDQGPHTLVGFTEVLSGWPLLLARPVYSPRYLSMQAQEWLKALAGEAEKRVSTYS
ncbi:MAG: SRPBCC family protein [Desulfarculus sp.]|nr:SRPBCC family protein [Desulfarculus sp.]